MDGAGRAGLDGSALAQAILDDAGADTRVDMDGTKILREPLPADGAASIMYPWCGRPRRYLYPLTLAANKLFGYQGPPCRECAGLRWASQETYRGIAARVLSAALRQPGRTRNPIPREPWDSRAVSHPRMLVCGFPMLVLTGGEGKVATECRGRGDSSRRKLA